MKELLQYMGVTIDGYGYAGQATEVVVPKLELATRNFSASGMSGPVKVRMARLASALEAEMTFEGFDPHLYDTFMPLEGETIPFTVRGSTQDGDGTIHAHKIVMRGFVESHDEGTWKEGEGVPLKLKLSLRHYERHIDGVEKWAANPEGMILRRNGVDLLAQHRANIGR